MMWEPVVSGDGECDGQLMLPHVKYCQKPKRQLAFAVAHGGCFGVG